MMKYILSCLFFISAIYSYLHADFKTDQARDIILKFKSRGYTNIRSEKDGLFNKKGKAPFLATLLAGESYLAVASSEAYSKDIALYIFDTDFKKLSISYKKHSQSGASLTFTPTKTGKYVFYLSSKKSRSYQFYLLSKRPNWLK